MFTVQSSYQLAISPDLLIPSRIITMTETVGQGKITDSGIKVSSSKERVVPINNNSHFIIFTGEFGVVYKGQIQITTSKSETVAIKTLKGIIIILSIS